MRYCEGKESEWKESGSARCRVPLPCKEGQRGRGTFSGSKYCLSLGEHPPPGPPCRNITPRPAGFPHSCTINPASHGYLVVDLVNVRDSEQAAVVWVDGRIHLFSFFVKKTGSLELGLVRHGHLLGIKHDIPFPLVPSLGPLIGDHGRLVGVFIWLELMLLDHRQH